MNNYNLRWSSVFIYPTMNEEETDIGHVSELLDQLILIFFTITDDGDAELRRTSFFIRYSDERGIHIRYRARCETPRFLMTQLIDTAIARGFALTVNNDVISLGSACNLTTGFLEPEFQRYGGVEFSIPTFKLFHLSSVFAYETIARSFSNRNGESLLIRCSIFVSVLIFYSKLGLLPNIRYDLSSSSMSGSDKSPHASEVPEMTELEIGLSAVNGLFDPDEYIIQSPSFSQFTSQLTAVGRAINVPAMYETFLYSHLHMLANRLGIPVTLEQRLYMIPKMRKS